MDRYWRIGNSFTAIQYVSKGMPDLFVVGVIIFSKRKLNKVWNEMKKLIPLDYYHPDLQDILKIEMHDEAMYIAFDTYEQGLAFVEFVENNFNDNHEGYAAMYSDGNFECEST
jgi:hypothetical protein